MKNLRQERERRPRNGEGWMKAKEPVAAKLGTICFSAWRRPSLAIYPVRHVVVFSSLVIAQLPKSDKEDLTWHLSISALDSNLQKIRASDDICKKVLSTFGVDYAFPLLEDNHHPGLARHFFIPCNPEYRAMCDCKEDEKVVTEPDGYQWTTPRDDSEGCRGCEYDRLTGHPCVIHKPGQIRLDTPFHLARINSEIVKN